MTARSAAIQHHTLQVCSPCAYSYEPTYLTCTSSTPTSTLTSTPTSCRPCRSLSLTPLQAMPLTLITHAPVCHPADRCRVGTWGIWVSEHHVLTNAGKPHHDHCTCTCYVGVNVFCYVHTTHLTHMPHRGVQCAYNAPMPVYLPAPNTLYAAPESAPARNLPVSNSQPCTVTNQAAHQSSGASAMTPLPLHLLPHRSPHRHITARHASVPRTLSFARCTHDHPKGPRLFLHCVRFTDMSTADLRMGGTAHG